MVRFDVLSSDIAIWTSLGTPTPFCRRFEFALRKGLEKSNTFLSASDTFLRESITKMASSPGALLAGLTQWRQESDGKQPIVYRVSLTPPVDHDCWRKWQQLPQTNVQYRIELGLAIARLYFLWNHGAIPLLPLTQNLHPTLPLPLNVPYEMGRQPLRTQLQYVISSRWQGFDIYLFI